MCTDNKLYDSSLLLRVQNAQLESQVIRGNVGVDSVSLDRISALEQKVLVQQEELTELHRRRGENAQMIIDLNAKLQIAEQAVTNKTERSVVFIKQLNFGIYLLIMYFCFPNIFYTGIFIRYFSFQFCY